MFFLLAQNTKPTGILWGRWVKTREKHIHENIGIAKNPPKVVKNLFLSPHELGLETALPLAGLRSFWPGCLYSHFLEDEIGNLYAEFVIFFAEFLIHKFQNSNATFSHSVCITFTRILTCHYEGDQYHKDNADYKQAQHFWEKEIGFFEKIMISNINNYSITATDQFFIVVFN